MLDILEWIETRRGKFAEKGGKGESWAEMELFDCSQPRVLFQIQLLASEGGLLSLVDQKTELLIIDVIMASV